MLRGQWQTIGFWGISIALFLVPLIGYGGSKLIRDDGKLNQVVVLNELQKGQIKTNQDPGVSITVHVSGAVKHPGIYQVRVGTKVHELLDHLEFSEGAKLDHLNVAKVLRDGQKVVVKQSVECIGKININFATAKELTMISGIGPATASKIVGYRDKNGPFSSMSELTKISGITDTFVQKVKDQIEF